MNINNNYNNIFKNTSCHKTYLYSYIYEYNRLASEQIRCIIIKLSLLQYNLCFRLFTVTLHIILLLVV